MYSFYKYSELCKLLHTKHTYIGAKIFAYLSHHAILPFLKEANLRDVVLLPIDDHVRGGYSHTAVMAHELKTVLPTIYGSIRAQNPIRYSGQKLKVRQAQKRDFKIKCKAGISAILIDDVVTTGNTLMEAQATCQKNDIMIAFAITLADAREDTPLGFKKG
ncbi:phosphoribosyltransferase [Sulfurospirillum sp. 1612]|uniref:phosphoribosyltransferase n=1 Tax=Sulfurospirillum sp. 1612 TaxID=3094835 RepID=UPI002F9460B4